MDRVHRLLKIRPGEARTVTRFLAFMVVVWTGFSVGGAGVEALLFARYGPRALPYIYIAVGAFTFLWMTGMTVLLRRRDPERLLLFLPLAFAAVVLIMRALLEASSDLVFPVLWILMMVMWTAQGQAVWGLASTLHDTRQAKRLFPLYGAGWILGSVLGGLATGPLARWFHAENLLVVWAACLVAAFLIARPLMGAGAIHAGRGRRRRGAGSRLAGPVRELAASLRSVRGSPLLLWMAVSLGLFALLYFVLTLVFAEVATARFPSADRLAGFLGLFMGVSSGIGFLTALFLANRLFARFGLVTMVLTLPVVYLVGFAVVSFSATFLAVAAFRLLQVVWVNGVWASAWQGLFSVVPAERRHRVRTFMDGVPLQLGIVAAGVLLILAEHVLAPSQVALIGVGAAALATLAMWRARAAYSGAVVEALRVGNPEVFTSEEEPFGGYRRDAAALSVLLEGTTDPDPAIRRTSMEILADMDSGAPDALARGLRDLDAGVRIAALRGVTRAKGASALRDVVRLLGDPEPDVRAGAAGAVAACSTPDRDLGPALGPLLSDPDPHVRARAAGTLLRRSNGAGEGRVALQEMASSPDPEWRGAAIATLGELGEELGAVMKGFADRDASVRRVAASALRGFDPQVSTGLLMEALGDPDPTVRDAAVETSVRFGTAIVDPLIEALAVPSRQDGALLALARLPGVKPASALRAFAREQVARAVHYHDHWRRLDPRGDDRLALLCYSLEHRALQHGVNALRAMPRDSASVEVAIENLSSRDPSQRANALEALEALGEPEIVRPLLVVWEASPRPSADPSAVLLEVLADDDPWLRACAALAAIAVPDGRVRPAIEQMARADPDAIARQAAGSALEGDRVVETIPTLPMMERVLFLRKVRLFGELTPLDLKHVAVNAIEHLYPDGELIAEEGDAGDEMHIVVSGEIRVVLDSGREGQVEVAARRSGDCVGEMAIVSEEPRMASLVAEGDVRTLSIDRSRFQRILRERPEASLAVIRVLCERLRESHSRDPGTVSV